MRVIKVSEASGAVLDWLVAKCEGEGIRVEGGKVRFALSQFTDDCDLYSPSTDWGQGGPILDQNQITWSMQMEPEHGGNTRFLAFSYRGGSGNNQVGPTKLIAAMRCYVAYKLGDTAEVPDELLR